MSDEIDIHRLQHTAELALSSSEYRRKYERHDFYTPNRFQNQLRETVARVRFVLGQAGGQIGKSTEAMSIVKGVATGERPLTNRPEPRLDRPYKAVIWILSETGQTTILGPQTRLLGDVLTGQVGTAMLPLRTIKKITYAHGTPGLVSEVVCEMVDGSLAIVRFRQYQQGKQALTSEAVDLIVCDELPPDKTLWAELLQRVSATGGTILVVATPGRQQSDIIAWFKEGGRDRAIVRGSVDDASHYSQEQKDAIKAAYLSVSEAEMRSRYYGDEFIGGGKVLTFEPADVLHDRHVDTFSPGAHWIIGLDLGHGALAASGHPTAACLCLWDKSTETLWVCKTYRQARVLPETVVSTILRWSKGGAPVAWGAAEHAGTGHGRETFAQMYRRLGLRMLPNHAVHDKGGVSIEDSVDAIQAMLSQGRLRIARECQELIQELLELERDEKGKLIPIRDDLWSALRYAEMMKKHARPVEDYLEEGVFDRMYREAERKPQSTGGDFNLFATGYDYSE